jgi:hypothetical protein
VTVTWTVGVALGAAVTTADGTAETVAEGATVVSEDGGGAIVVCVLPLSSGRGGV